MVGRITGNTKYFGHSLTVMLKSRKSQRCVSTIAKVVKVTVANVCTGPEHSKVIGQKWEEFPYTSKREIFKLYKYKLVSFIDD